MQTFEDFWDKVDNISFRTRESLASESFAAAAGPRDQEIERLRAENNELRLKVKMLTDDGTEAAPRGEKGESK